MRKIGKSTEMRLDILQANLGPSCKWRVSAEPARTKARTQKRKRDGGKKGGGGESGKGWSRETP